MKLRESKEHYPPESSLSPSFQCPLNPTLISIPSCKNQSSLTIHKSQWAPGNKVLKMLEKWVLTLKNVAHKHSSFLLSISFKMLFRLSQSSRTSFFMLSNCIVSSSSYFPIWTKLTIHHFFSSLISFSKFQHYLSFSCSSSLLSADSGLS